MHKGGRENTHLNTSMNPWADWRMFVNGVDALGSRVTTLKRECRYLDVSLVQCVELVGASCV